MRCFFFFKQKTAYEMRISDWSSDVCSSDLPGKGGGRDPGRFPEQAVEIAWRKPGLGGQPLQPRRGFGRFDQGDGAGDSGPGGILIVRAAPQAGAQPVRPCAFGVGVEADVFRPWTACGAGGAAIDAGRDRKRVVEGKSVSVSVDL